MQVFFFKWDSFSVFRLIKFNIEFDIEFTVYSLIKETYVELCTHLKRTFFTDLGHDFGITFSSVHVIVTNGVVKIIVKIILSPLQSSRYGILHVEQARK